MRKAVCLILTVLATPAAGADRIGETARSFRDYCHGDRVQMCGDIISGVYGGLIYGIMLHTGESSDPVDVTGCIPDDETMPEIAIQVLGSLRASNDPALLDIELAAAISDILIRRYPCS